MSRTTVRRRVHYSGRVQGVGFRFASQCLAQDHSVGGYVRNLHDGRVELVAEGEPEAVEALLAAVRWQFRDFIDDTQVVTEPPDDPPLAEFSIRY
jgi:acylphosphatase